MVYKYIDIVGTSDTDISAAVVNAFKEASSTVNNIKWGELGRVTFRVEEGKKDRIPSTGKNWF
jgi:dodecin